MVSCMCGALMCSIPCVAATDHTVHHQQDRSVLRDVLQCVLFIGGMSLVMWIGFMVVYNQLQPSEGGIIL